MSRLDWLKRNAGAVEFFAGVGGYGLLYLLAWLNRINGAEFFLGFMMATLSWTWAVR